MCVFRWRADAQGGCNGREGTHLVVKVRDETEGVVIGWLVEGCVGAEGRGEDGGGHMVDDDVEKEVHAAVVQSLREGDELE